MRRHNHSIETVVNVWLKTPGVMVVSEGTSIVERRIADKVSILMPDNDAVTLELDEDTHLPLLRTFKYRNAEFKDWDEDSEGYEDYHTIQGLPTPLQRHPLPQRRQLPGQRFIRKSRIQHRHGPRHLRRQQATFEEIVTRVAGYNQPCHDRTEPRSGCAIRTSEANEGHP